VQFVMSREGDDDGAHWHAESTVPNPRRRRVAVGRYLECLGEILIPPEEDQIESHVVVFKPFRVGLKGTSFGSISFIF